MSEAGEILGRLKLDASQFFTELDRAQGRAEELSTADPKIRVTTEGTGKAVAELEAVKVAEDHVEAGTRKVAAAQKDGQKQAVDWGGALVGSLVAASAAAPPVAAAAVGLTGAFGVMAGAGILGLAGIVRGLKENNAVGLEYRGTVNSLAASFHSAQDAAANGLFPGVQASASLLRQDMPVLNGEIQHFAGMLGAMLPTGLDATVTLLERANPLFDAAGGYLQSIVQGLDNWSHGNGYQDFLNYSIQQLPQVEHLLGDAGHLVIDFLKAWAPVGTQTLPLLDGIVVGVDDIVKSTGPLVPAVIAGVGAFNLLKPVVGTIMGVTAALKGMTVAEEAAAVAGGKIKVGGPSGLGGGLVAGTAGVLGVAAVGMVGAGMLGQDYSDATGLTKSQQQYAKSKGSTYVGDLNQASPVGLGIQNLSGMGAFGRGLAQGPLGWLMKGNLLGDATGLNNPINAAQNLDNQDKALAGQVDAGKSKQAAATFAQITQAAKDQGVSLSALKQMYPQYTAAVAAAGHANTAAVPPVNDLEAAYQKQQTAMGAASTKALALEGAQNSAKDSIAAASAAVKANGASLDQNTAKGRANREAVMAAVQAIEANGAAMVKNGASTATAAVSNDKMALSLEHSLESMGMGKKAAESYINSLMGIPKNRTTEAQLKIDQARAAAAQAKQFAADYVKGDYTAILRGNFTDAQKKAAQAAEYSKLFAAGNYKAILKGDYTPAEKAAATAKEKALAYAKAQYQAALKADNNPANHAIKSSLDAALAFARGKYDALLHVSSNASQAARAAEAELQSVQDRNVTLAVHYVQTGQNMATGGAKYGFAAGGTIGSVPGLASGGSGLFSGTVTGPGNAWNDMAGLFRLANGEEVISNRFGQADQWRPFLKAINNQTVRSPAQLAAAAAPHPAPQPPQVVRHIEPHVTINYPATQDPVQAAQEAAQLIQAYAGLG